MPTAFKPRSMTIRAMSGFAQPILDSTGTLAPNVALIEKPFSGPSLLRRGSEVLQR